jgi:cadmium resistance protein CadD (predicted permease)
MFSTIVAAIVFVLTAFILLFWIYDEFIREKSEIELVLARYDKRKINWLNVWIVIGLWIGSGVYLWG